ncbi:hypothetical protein JMN32_00200 [Fulvivirga sp. 29W222]|uniref:Uncharacterized protein n=1 Tax=Fulvivirga marina TaxID=2494733 RepID=A0A937KC04_9BACT|nr:hypothetical protein [Fulvivirga marina]MBL6444708.1 hypothetical protein [Fulvivirga marina]
MAGCFFYTRLTVKSRLILLLVLAACIPQLARAFLGRIPALNIFYNINVVVELFILYFFFRKSYSTNRKQQIFKILGAVCLLLGVISISYWGVESKFLTEWLCINNLVYTSWILLSVLDIYENDDRLLHTQRSYLLFLLGLFLYTSCTMLIFGLWHYIMANSDSLLKNLWIIHDVFNTIMYLVFLIGFYIDYRRQTKPIRP